jgi:hypothetical protein
MFENDRPIHAKRAIFLIGLRAFLELVRFDLYVMRGNFLGLRERVHRQRIGRDRTSPDAIEQISSAVDRASTWYWKEVLCLQRSAATACLLKRYGIPAEMVIGVQQMPFQAHAWVEVGGLVVNDKPYMPEIYSVLDRC